VCGVVAAGISGAATSVLTARVPLDAPLELGMADGLSSLTDAEGAPVGRAGPADPAVLPVAPASPGVEAARAAGDRCLGHGQKIHPICFTCGPERGEGDGLRVFVGQLEGAPTGHVAGVWTPHPEFADGDGLVPSEVVWAALDCPGFFAWVEKEGRHGALLGTMSCEIVRRPRAGEETVVLAWPLERQGRKETAGIALFAADGELLARAHQVWITLAAGFPAKPAEAVPATA
jgi:hypothetical protein